MVAGAGSAGRRLRRVQLVVGRRDLLGDTVEESEAAVLSGLKVAALLAGQDPDSSRPGPGWRSLSGAKVGFGANAYRKWTGAHWRLVSLVELGVPAGDPRALAAAEQVLGGLAAAGANPRRPRCRRPGAAVCLRGGQRLGRLLPAGIGRRRASPASQRLTSPVAVARRRLELRREGNRTTLVVPRDIASGMGVQEYALATGDEAGRRAVPFPSPVPLALHRHGHQVGVARPPLSAVLPLRHPPGPAHPRAARLCHRSPRRGRRRRPCASSVRGRHLGAREGVGGSKWEQATTAAAASWPRRPRWSTGAGQGQTR
jgi:hypothetical protein